MSETPRRISRCRRRTRETVRLSDFRGKSEVVLFFYPKDHSLACTMEVCSFRDSYEAFREAGAEVIGIGADSEISHQASPSDSACRSSCSPTAMVWSVHVMEFPGRSVCSRTCQLT